jgi:glycosyltransferase involved in cell wall biosynthesis
MTKPKISILIANYNNGIFFEDCYKSLVAQTSADWEAIVFDDCSTDDSVQIITEKIADDQRFRFYQNEENIGYQKTLIKAVELSEAEIFGRLDPDDALHPCAISAMLEAHQQLPEAGLIYSNFTICDEQLKPLKTHYAAQVQGLDEKYLNFDSEISHFATFKKSVYLQTGGFDPINKRAEDKDMYMKMCEVAPVKHLDEALYLYRMHSGGSSSHSNEEKALFWHVVALIKMSERRNINIEDVFVDKFVPRTFAELELEQERAKIKRVKNSRIIILLSKLGLINFYNDL